ncbi:glycerol-3-phosphate 1-O-acyltransferase PlsY [Polymorphobacter sp.]|uniref:glycerol-3-phosphate 1-O-acyltransferase PlsY n=1 Tax=Polymorphobacter sp. TaxID=1909290 RepID=UPI003F715AD2
MGLDLLPALALGYLLGSIPFGWLMTRAAGIDIRAVGSGNIGTTNVLRTGRKGLAVATLLLDAGKAVAAVLLARHFWGEGAAQAAAAAAFVGHLWPVWLGFRGGKGVATLLGLALAAVPLAGVAALLAWVGGALATRYSSVGGMLSAVAAPVAALLLGQPGWALLMAALALALISKHRDNIARLRSGTESRIGQKG